MKEKCSPLRPNYRFYADDPRASTPLDARVNAILDSSCWWLIPMAQHLADGIVPLGDEGGRELLGLL